MQVPKEEVRERILAAARTEFSAKGFKKASMRTIAARARVTPGNIYAYFPGKENLFAAIVTPVAEAIRRIYDQDFQLQGGALVLSQISEEIVTLFLHHGSDFLILLDGSAGSSYELTREQLRQIIVRRIEEYIFPRFKAPARDSLLAQAWAGALLEGLLTLLNGAAGDEQRLRCTVSTFLNRMFPEDLY